MSKIFVSLYHYFESHRVLFYLLLGVLTAVLSFYASKVRFEEDVTRFFPDTDDSEQVAAVFRNLQVKDKIVVMVSASDTTVSPAPAELIEAASAFEEKLRERVGETHIRDIFSRVDPSLVTGVTDLIYSHLPIFLTEDDYLRIDSLLAPEGLDRQMQRNYRNLLSPAGAALKDMLKRDPLGVGNTALSGLRDLQLTANYTIYDDRIFSQDMSTLLLFISPRFGTGSTGENERLITAIETLIRENASFRPAVNIDYFGGPSVAVYNARQIKKDTMLTLTVALLIVLVFISVVFRRKSAILLINLPVLFGGVFSLAVIYFIKGSVSAIAIGAGAAVFGIAMSYSIHVLSHRNHVRSVPQLIEELAYPLTVGSFTTVGAFFGLVFTSSDLLRDFGLFSSFALIGTTMFCLVFLPHFLKGGEGNAPSGRVLRVIERINRYAFDRNPWLVGCIVVAAVAGLFLSPRVTFDNDMMNLNYEPPRLLEAESRLQALFPDDKKTVLFVSTGKTLDEGLEQYAALNRTLERFLREGKIQEYASAGKLLVPTAVQQERIARWDAFWTPERKAALREQLPAAGKKYHFRENTFDTFLASLDKTYAPYDFRQSADLSSRLLSEWTSEADSLLMLVTQVRLAEADKEEVYDHFINHSDVIIFDRGYFANKWVTAINNDFYLILYISSFLIFFALLVSYGRIELTLMTFTPMAISWVVILGFMALFGIEFNIVNIILSTFIFGIGDDFSIFIMDGLQNDYRSGKKMLAAHKTAIFFSAFTTVVGMGALVFAEHPALKSIALISLLGMAAVVLVSFTVQPILFRWFIAGPAAKGYFPYTFSSLLMTGYAFFTFVAGCLLMTAFSLVLFLVPVRKERKKLWFGYGMMYLLRFFLRSIFTVKKVRLNPAGETLKRPAVIIANHQSFVDILVLLSLSPRLIMVTNSWVWNSPFFGRIVRYADFFCTDDGYEAIAGKVGEKVRQGYSLVVFPEGTRSEDCRLRRFHKGAFYLADRLQLDIVPVVLYGNGMVVSKRQPFYVKHGIIVSQMLPRIPYGNQEWGDTYQVRCKRVTAYFREAYEKLCREYNVASNPYFYQKLITNYIYKGPVEEWYMRIKVKMEHNYRFFDELVSRRARIVDVGCGYGPLAYMLAMLSPERDITGIDYDEDKIAVANRCFSRTEHIRFIAANALDFEMPVSDVFILNDMLHYLDYASQERLLQRCIGRLAPEGFLLVRDGNAANGRKHRLTRLSELFSTRITRFNKVENELYFTSTDRMQQTADACGLSLQTVQNDKYTSNTIYIFRKKHEEGGERR